MAKSAVAKGGSPANSGVEITFWFVLWYATSVVCTNSSKILSRALSPQDKAAGGRVLTLLQLIASALLGWAVLSSGVAGVSMRSCAGFSGKMWVLGGIFALAFLSLNVGMGEYLEVSMAMVLRATEPIFAVVILAVTGKTVSLDKFFTLLLLVIGAGMSVYTEPDFDPRGLACLAAANVGFTLRSLVAKQVKDAAPGFDNVSLFFHTCWRGAVCQGLIVMAMDIGTLRAAMAAFHAEPKRIAGLIALNGVAFFMYLQASFIVLSKVGVVSHTVGNSLRRPVCIGCALLYFGNPTTVMAMCGIALACVGAALYSLLKIREQRKKEA